ncbi:MAG: hypothetical protein BGO01_00760 [Armatimonadetes bacterium 55-13]|nr:hypothetical protein [Armatimonadota bacterium]OJU62335.1 MAG: hypothetical protein BGO01_00760 [Armatimonadetes bacterium 55-13]
MKYLLLAFIAGSLASGCGSRETTYVDANGTRVSTSTDGNRTTVTDDKGNKLTFEGDGKQGTYSVEDENGNKSTFGASTNITEAELGLAFYPGSEKIETGGAVFEDDKQRTVTCSFTSKDEPQAIVDFYKGKIKDAKSSMADVGETKAGGVSGKREDGSEVSLSISKETGKDANITIVVTKKKR